jgi:hypothetical protein
MFLNVIADDEPIELNLTEQVPKSLSSRDSTTATFVIFSTEKELCL